MYGPGLDTSSLGLIEWAVLLPPLVASLSGAFAGALAAYYLARWQRLRDEERQQVAAGNVALSILLRQLNDFATVQAGVRQRIAERQEKYSVNRQLWFDLVPPIHYSFVGTLKFDLGSLAFLFEKGDVTVFNKLFHAEQLYADLVHVFREQKEAGRLALQALEAAGFGIDAAIAPEDLWRAFPPTVIGKLTNTRNALVERIGSDEQDYKEAWNALRAELIRLFPNKKFTDISKNANPLGR